MLEIIGAIIQIIILIFKNKFEKDKEKKVEKEKLSGEINEALKTRDISKLNSVIVRLRK